MNKKICIVYTHHKLGDLIWQLPYLKAISDHHGEKVVITSIAGALGAISGSTGTTITKWII